VIAAVFIVAQLSLVAASRPPECGVDGTMRGTNIWERAKHPELRHYCDLLATGTSKLTSQATASDALREADEADQAMPGHAAPLTLKGRALAKAGRYTEAYAAFTEAKKRETHALDDSAALREFARACARSGHAPEALAAFRSLLPRADGLNSFDRAPTYVEAAFQAMSAGTANVDDAIAMLRQARREAGDALQPVATLALALALDRSGARDEAKAVLDDRAKAKARDIARDPTMTPLLGPLASEAEAMAAVGLEASDPAASQAAWQRYIAAAGQTGAWVDHAKGHLAVTRTAHPVTGGGARHVP
jgi:tetratricopeptide (TPR) repeat protein